MMTDARCLTSDGCPSILITGASGFVGSHLVELSLAKGFEVWAAVRAASSRRWLADERINIIVLSLNDAAALRGEIEAFVDQHDGKGWDYVVHVAGATKARNEIDFMRSNCEATENLATTLLNLNVAPRRFVLMSSLSAVPMAGGFPVEGQAPTAYGRSKMAAEECLLALSPRLDYVVLRPTAVYGPRDKDLYLVAKSVRGGMSLSVGRKPQHLTFIYVNDLCEAALLALTKGRSGAVYQLSDGRTYSSSDYCQLLQHELGVRRMMHIVAPLWLVKGVCYASEWLSHITRSMTVLNIDKYNLLKQRDWSCDIHAAQSELGFEPRTALAEGVAKSVAWYKQQKWI
ncbi:MAG: NAD-dependent epimerase/dehydratase family protein [Prevotellaceae bacterium]|nr:NAD-dependent epimerase/dehydratase family protein [Prevotellaceae bacterium]